MKPSDWIVPSILSLVAVFALLRKVDVFAALRKGASDGLGVVLHILPSLIVLLCAVSMVRASGALDALTSLLAPLLQKLGIPSEVAPLLFVRPLSGSAALAVGADLIHTYGVNSTIGRTAAVMLGASETTFYTIAVYFGAADIHKTRYAIPAALCADLAMFLSAAWSVRILMGT